MTYNKKSWRDFLPVCLLALFIFIYALDIPFLLPYGDATIHAFHSNTLIEKWWSSVRADYPAFYYYITAYLQLSFWFLGYSISVMLGLFLILTFSYLICRLFTKNLVVWILTILLISQSTKLINYSFRLYQEILITSFFLISFYYSLKYFLLNRSQKDINFLIFFISLSVATKQQWMLILWPTYCLLFFILFLFKRSTFKILFLFILVPLIIALPFYWILFHNKWIFILWNTDFLTVRFINYLGQKLFHYAGEEWSIPSLKDVFIAPEQLNYVNISSIAAQERQTTFVRAFSSLPRFNEIHLVYTIVGSWNSYLFLQNILLVLLFFWFFKKYKTYYPILLFIFIFMAINYFLFARNSDQARYHVFIPFILFIFSLSSVNYFILHFKILSLILTFIFIFSLPWLTYSRILSVYQGAIKTQIYSSSVWGIQSIQESWYWSRKNLDSESNILHTCGNEFGYYSNMNNMFTLDSGEVYFYEKRRLDAYIQERNIDYVVILKSQIIKDHKWNNFCRVPEFFYNNIANMYPIIFTSSKNDIFIYEVKKIPHSSN